jgi:putative transposase
MSRTLSERRKMIEMQSQSYSISEQCRMLSIHRSGLYYGPVGESEENLILMRLIDEQYLKTPFFGFRKMTKHLIESGYNVNRKRVRRLMRLMGLTAIYSKRFLSDPDKNHRKYPYLLKGLKIEKTNQVWSADITYIPMKRGFLYLLAIMDLHSRYVINWSLSNSMDADWCASVLKEAIEKHGKPKIFNTDQGSQFTSEAFTGILLNEEIQISMDGKGRACDNIFIERLWRSVKYENIYLHAYQDGVELYKGLEDYFHFYNKDRYHQSLDYKTPFQIYRSVA